MHDVLYHTPSFKTNYYSMLHLYVVMKKGLISSHRYSVNIQNKVDY